MSRVQATFSSVDGLAPVLSFEVVPPTKPERVVWAISSWEGKGDER